MELSVAIIFKNEIRCLERCLRSLLPLKKRVSCEIVMADTGSTDGSREIAERYADVVFDFPWVNDFSAARNAVLDRCTGAWALVMDCDEWLDGDIRELTTFLRGGRKERFDQVMLTIRNYSTASLDEYGDSKLYRLLNLASEPRYVGAIHEYPEFPRKERNAEFDHTVLHHDGYVMLNDGSQAGEAKRARNIALLRAELDRSPDDLRRLMQFVESGDREPDRGEKLRHAVSLIEARRGEWERYGPPLLSYAVQLAYKHDLPELEPWGREAFELFPGSYFTRIDAAYILAAHSFEQQDFSRAARYGEEYLQARRDYAGDDKGRVETTVSILQRDDDGNERDILVVLARAYTHLGQPERALSLLSGWPWEETDGRQVKNFLVALRELRASAETVDILPLLLDCQERIQKPVPSAERARERMSAFEALYAVTDSAPPPPSQELLQLAEKVRAILEKYPADDPAIIDLKSSAAYQKVKHLIER